MKLVRERFAMCNDADHVWDGWDRVGASPSSDGPRSVWEAPLFNFATTFAILQHVTASGTASWRYDAPPDAFTLWFHHDPDNRLVFGPPIVVPGGYRRYDLSGLYWVKVHDKDKV